MVKYQFRADDVIVHRYRIQNGVAVRESWIANCKDAATANRICRLLNAFTKDGLSVETDKSMPSILQRERIAAENYEGGERGSDVFKARVVCNNLSGFVRSDPDDAENYEGGERGTEGKCVVHHRFNCGTCN